jgi:hypothetical protein
MKGNESFFPFIYFHLFSFICVYFLLFAGVALTLGRAAPRRQRARWATADLPPCARAIVLQMF